MLRGLMLAAVVTLTACGGSSAPAQAPAGPPVSFSLPSDQGALVNVPLANARTTILDFFSPTCAPCKQRVPELLGKRDELAGKGAKIVLVGLLSDAESTDTARQALASWGVSSPFLVDRADTSKVEAGVTALPTTLVVDASGKVLFRSTATSTVDDVVAAVP